MKESYFYLLSITLIMCLTTAIAALLGAPEIVVKAAILFFALFLLLSIGTVIQYLINSRSLDRVRRRLGVPLSDSVMQQIRQRPDLLKTEVQKKELTIMVTDVSNFIDIINRPGYDAARISGTIQQFLNLIDTRVIHNNGTLGKCTSSGRLAFWNAPFDDPLHARSATRAARDILGDVNAVNVAKKTDAADVEMVIGLSTGPVLVGTMGSDYCSNYNCCGHDVVLASWLKDQCRSYGVRILVDESTAGQIQDVYRVIELDQVISPVYTKPVRVYTVITADQPQNEILHRRFLRAYHSGQWDDARAYAQELARAFDGELKDYYVLMLQRISDAERARLAQRR